MGFHRFLRFISYFCGCMRMTAAQRKMVSSLGSARGRRQEGLFVAEGERCLSELTGCFRLRYLVATAQWIETNLAAYQRFTKGLSDDSILIARNDELARISSMKTPQGVMGVFELPGQDFDVETADGNGLYIALDCVQDPGNLGTIIRIADWFGVGVIFASEDTVDLFNPKVVQATMGGLARVKVVYCDLPSTLRSLADRGLSIYGTFLDGENLYSAELNGSGVVVMGNEGNGISAEAGKCVDSRIRIPSFPPDTETVESLNVATATAITIAEFRRRKLR